MPAPVWKSAGIAALQGEPAALALLVGVLVADATTCFGV